MNEEITLDFQMLFSVAGYTPYPVKSMSPLLHETETVLSYFFFKFSFSKQK